MGYYKNNIFLRCLKIANQAYLALEEKINHIYLNGFTYRFISRSIKLIKIGFKFNIFGRLSWIEQDALRDLFQTSKIIRAILILTQGLKDKMIAFSVTSYFFTSIRDLKRVFFSEPLKVAGIIIIVMITINTILSIILQNQINLWGWIIRGLFLFLGISGLFCNTDWKNIKDSSLVLTVVR